MAISTRCEFTGDLPGEDGVDPDSVLVRWEVDEVEFSDWFWNNAILAQYRSVDFTAPTTLYVAAHSTESSTTAAGTELTGSGYARVQVTFDRVSDILVRNLSTYSFPLATSEWPTVASLSIWDSDTGGNYYAYGNFAEAISVPVNDAIIFPAETGITIGKRV